VLPRRDDDGQVAKAASIYTAFLDVRDTEVTRLEDLLKNADPPLSTDHRLQVTSLRDFWKQTVDEAMNRPIPGHQGRRNTLAAIDAG